MNIIVSFNRNHPNTVSGDSITVTTTYSSFNQQLIDELEEKFNKTIKTYQLFTIPDDSVRIEELDKFF